MHFMRNALAKVSKQHTEMVAATIRTIFAQPKPDDVRGHLDTVAGTLDKQFPAVADLLRQANARFETANQALARGDLAAYQRDINDARDLIRRATEASAASAAAPTPTTSTTVRATA